MVSRRRHGLEMVPSRAIFLAVLSTSGFVRLPAMFGCSVCVSKVLLHDSASRLHLDRLLLTLYAIGWLRHLQVQNLDGPSS